MKPRARYSHRLNTWAWWQSEDDWTYRRVGFGWDLEGAFQDWLQQSGSKA